MYAYSSMVFCLEEEESTTATSTTTTTACADIWGAAQCKKKEEGGKCDPSCTTDDCVKTQANCKKKCKIC